MQIIWQEVQWKNKQLSALHRKCLSPTPVPLSENDSTFRKLHADNFNPSSSSVDLTLIPLVFPVGNLSPLYLFLPLSPSHLCLTRSLTVTRTTSQCKNNIYWTWGITAEPGLMYLLCNNRFLMILQNLLTRLLDQTRCDRSHTSLSQLQTITALSDIIVRRQKSFSSTAAAFSRPKTIKEPLLPGEEGSWKKLMLLTWHIHNTVNCQDGKKWPYMCIVCVNVCV